MSIYIKSTAAYVSTYTGSTPDAIAKMKYYLITRYLLTLPRRTRYVYSRTKIVYIINRVQY